MHKCGDHQTRAHYNLIISIQRPSCLSYFNASITVAAWYLFIVAVPCAAHEQTDAWIQRHQRSEQTLYNVETVFIWHRYTYLFNNIKSSKVISKYLWIRKDLKIHICSGHNWIIELFTIHRASLNCKFNSRFIAFGWNPNFYFGRIDRKSIFNCVSNMK